MSSTLSPAIAARVVHALRTTTKSYRAIARECGCSPQWVLNLAREHRLARARSRDAMHARNQTILRARQNGRASVERLAATFQLSERRIRQIAKEIA